MAMKDPKILKLSRCWGSVIRQQQVHQHAWSMYAKNDFVCMSLELHGHTISTLVTKHSFTYLPSGH